MLANGRDLPIMIYCRGGEKHAPRLAQRAGWLYGTRHDYTPYAWPYMIDYNWHRPDDWPRYVEIVKRYRPAIAMVPDLERPEQLPQLWDQIEEIRPYVGRVMACPKYDGAARAIPAHCLIAISVPAPEYSGFLPDASEIIGRNLHLLGGEPDQHVYLANVRYRGAHVCSIDQNAIWRKAEYGQFWSARQARWRQMPARKYSTFTLALMSARGINRYYRPNALWRPRARVRACYPSPPQQLALGV